jgi:hypothetical protein
MLPDARVLKQVIHKEPKLYVITLIQLVMLSLRLQLGKAKLTLIYLSKRNQGASFLSHRSQANLLSVSEKFKNRRKLIMKMIAPNLRRLPILNKRSHPVKMIISNLSTKQ